LDKENSGNMNVSGSNTVQIMEDAEQKKALIQQNKMIASIKRSLVTSGLNTVENMTTLLTHNKQEVPVGIDLVTETNIVEKIASNLGLKVGILIYEFECDMNRSWTDWRMLFCSEHWIHARFVVDNWFYGLK
jgi:hypothetical protein